MSVTNKPVINLATKTFPPFLVKIMAAVSGLVLNLMAANAIPMHEFGIFSVAQVLILFMVTLAKFGLDATVVKVISSNLKLADLGSVNSMYSLAIAFAIFGTLLVGSTVYTFGEFISSSLLGQPELNTIIPIILLLVLPNALLGVNSSTFRAYRKPIMSVAFSGLVTASLSIAFIALFPPLSAQALLQIIACAAGISCLTSFIICFFHIDLRVTSNNWPTKVVKSSLLPLWMTSIVALVIQQFSTLMVAKYVSLEQVGIYAVALKIGMLMTFFLFAVNTIVGPRFAALHAAGKKQELAGLAKTTNILLFVISIFALLVTMLLAKPILALFGPEFVQGAPLLRILATGYAINLATGSVISILIMTGHEKLHRNNTLFVGLITIVAAFVLIPRFGAIGAALTTAGAMTIQNLIAFYWVHRHVLTKN